MFHDIPLISEELPKGWLYGINLHKVTLKQFRSLICMRYNKTNIDLSSITIYQDGRPIEGNDLCCLSECGLIPDLPVFLSIEKKYVNESTVHNENEINRNHLISGSSSDSTEPPSESETETSKYEENKLLFTNKSSNNYLLESSKSNDRKTNCFLSEKLDPFDQNTIVNNMELLEVPAVDQAKQVSEPSKSPSDVLSFHRKPLLMHVSRRKNGNLFLKGMNIPESVWFEMVKTLNLKILKIDTVHIKWMELSNADDACANIICEFLHARDIKTMKFYHWQNEKKINYKMIYNANSRRIEQPDFFNSTQKSQLLSSIDIYFQKYDFILLILGFIVLFTCIYIDLSYFKLLAI